MKEQISPAQYLRRSKAAAMLDVCIPIIDGMIRRGELPVVRVGRRLRIPASALNSLANQKGPSQAA